MPQPVKKEAGRPTTVVPIGDLSVVLKAPVAGQIASLRRIVHLLESEDVAARAQGGEMFLDLADTLVQDDTILNRLYTAMAKEETQLEEYADGLVAALKEFLPSEDDGPNPIKSTRRPAKAVAAPRRGRAR